LRTRSAAAAAISLAALSFATACATPSRIRDLGPDLQLLHATEWIWVHVSEDETERWGTIPANGMLLVGEEESLLIDTGWNEPQAARIAEFARDQLEKPIRTVIVTHAHGDRMGGLRAIAAPEVVVYAHELTAGEVAKLALPLKKVIGFEQSLDITIGGHPLELYYPGGGHTKDNITVWLPEAKILFGGCIVKSGRSTDLGNREDAVLAEWPMSLLRLLQRYPTVELVIPGHGPPGGSELLHHTLGLLEQVISSTSGNGHH
jgi:metallo-beta-lactamase class B